MSMPGIPCPLGYLKVHPPPLTCLHVCLLLSLVRPSFMAFLVWKVLLQSWMM